jgi:Mrp family chromosome partitioning ATPase
LSQPQQGWQGPSLLEHLWLRKWSVAFITIVAAASAFYFSLRQEPIFAAEAKILVEAVGDQALNMSTEQELVRSRAMAGTVLPRLDLSIPVVDLLEDLSIEVPSDSQVLVLTFTHADRDIARQVAQGFATTYITSRERAVEEAEAVTQRELEEGIGLLESELRVIERQLSTADEFDPELPFLLSRASSVSEQLAQRRLDLLRLQHPQDVGKVIQPATILGQVFPTPARSALLGTLLGMSLGIAQATLRGRVDNRLRSIGDAERLVGSSALALVPSLPKSARDVLELNKSRSRRRNVLDPFVRLAVALSATLPRRPAPVLAVTSSSAGEGRTTVSALLASVLARSGNRVMLVCCDPRARGLEEMFGTDGVVGLTDVIGGRAAIDDAVLPTPIDGLNLLPHGQGAGLEGVLDSTAGSIFDALASTSDYVLLDVPPLTHADGLALASLASGVLFVIDARRMNVPSLLFGCQQLMRARVSLVGLVFSRVKPSMVQRRAVSGDTAPVTRRDPMHVRR